MTARTPPRETEPAAGAVKSSSLKNRKDELRRQHEEWLELAGKQVLENIERLRAQAEQYRKNHQR